MNENREGRLEFELKRGPLEALERWDRRWLVTDGPIWIRGELPEGFVRVEPPFVGSGPRFA
jgi:hypothetical protein